MSQFMPGLLALMQGNDNLAAQLLSQAGTPAAFTQEMAKAPKVAPTPVPSALPAPSSALPAPSLQKAQTAPTSVAGMITANAASPEQAAVSDPQEDFIRALAGVEAPPSNRPPTPSVVAPRGGGSVQPNAVRALLGMLGPTPATPPTLGSLFKR